MEQSCFHTTRSGPALERTAPADKALTPEACDALFAPLSGATGVLLAVSGGPDSMALMRLAAAWRGRVGGPSLAVATIDHGLRPESRSEAQYVANVAADLGLAHAVLDWAGPKPESRLQEQARAARYQLLIAHALRIGATHLVTAHTLDDQAETILFRLARGSGPAGLIGMRSSVRRGPIIHLRPLLSVRKAALVATCRANQWRYFEDPSNEDTRFARTRWRKLLPLLAKEGLAAERFATLSLRLERAETALQRITERAAAAALLERHGTCEVYDGKRLLDEPEEIVLRVLARALEYCTPQSARGPIRLERLESLGSELLAALSAGRPFKRTLAGGLVSAESNGRLAISREPPRRRGTPRVPLASG